MKKTLLITAVCCLFLNQSFATEKYLLPAQKGGLWGFIDKNEYWVIPAQYDNVTQFVYGLAAVESYGQWGYINSGGDWVIEPGFSKAKPFSEGLAAVKTSGKWGFINLKGEWVIEPDFLALSSFSNGLAVIYTEDGFAYIDQAGNIAIENTYQLAKPFSEGLASVIENGYKRYIDLSGNWIIHHDYDKADSFAEGLALIQDHGRFGYINNRGDVIIPLRYEDANYFSEGLASVQLENQWGYIDKTGNLVISAKFEYAGPFKHGYAVVRHYGKYGLIDSYGNWVINPEYRDLMDLGKTITLEEEVIQLVDLRIKRWEKKGEFEKTSEYLKRVTEEAREEEVKKQMQLAINELANRYVSLDQAELGLYNADAEMFSLYIPGMISSLIPVPIKDAIQFKNNWDKVILRNPEFSIYDDRFVLTQFDAVLGEDVYSYNAFRDGVYASNFKGKPNLGRIKITLPELPLPLEESHRPVTFKMNSDVDRNIPVNPYLQQNVFALVIGNEDYETFQVGLESGTNVKYAEADAIIFTEYLKKTVGVPEENITLLINATAGQINQALAKMSALAKAYDGKAEFVFYYAGHGLPDEESREPYLIPVDVAASDLSFAIPLEEVYEKLTDYQSGKVTLFIDACFSGGARYESLVASRGVRIRPKSPFVMGNLIVFSASREMQSAYSWDEKNHGMFTYHILKKLQESNGYVKYGELADYLEREVNKRSLLVNNREQEPTVKVSPILEYTWRDFSLMTTGEVRNE